MKKKKNKFLTFIFSMMPGAGHMYMGFMNKGLIYMSLFMFCVALASVIYAPIFIFPAIIIWFYAFFECINIRNLDDEEFTELEDDINLVQIALDKIEIDKNKSKLIVAFSLIAMGAYTFLERIHGILANLISIYLGDFAFEIFYYSLPKMAFSLLLIIIGVRLLKKNNESYNNPNFKEFDEFEIDLNKEEDINEK